MVFHKLSAHQPDAALHVRVNPNHPVAPTQLFVQAISNYLKASFGHKCPHRHTALSQPVEVPEDTSFWARAGSGLAWFMKSPLEKIDEHYSQANATLESDADDAVRITDGEARWVIERIARCGETDETEEALLKRLNLDNAA